MAWAECISFAIQDLISRKNIFFISDFEGRTGLRDDFSSKKGDSDLHLRFQKRFMLTKDFKFIEISAEDSRSMRPDLPLSKDSDFDRPKFEDFFEKVKRTVSTVDLKELDALAEEKILSQVLIYITHGVESLYDAWTVSDNDQAKIFLNADGFEYRFETQDAFIVTHELVHLLIEDRLPQIAENDFLGQYHRIMIDEGLAHFLSFPFRDKIQNYREHYEDKKKWAEERFYENLRLLISDISESEKKRILHDGNTGSYWHKHASIYGLFLFADLFQKRGLSACLERLKSFCKSPNLRSLFSDDLQDYPENPTDLKKFVEIEKNEIKKLTGEEKYKRLSRLAVQARQLRNYEEAHVFFKEASQFFEINSPKMEMINYLRWADNFRFEKKFAEAWTLLKKAENTLLKNNFVDYQDFYLQHLGKLYFDKNDYKEALSCFEKTLLLRKKKKNPELISSTEFAIEIAKKNLKNMNLRS